MILLNSLGQRLPPRVRNQQGTVALGAALLAAVVALGITAGSLKLAFTTPTVVQPLVCSLAVEVIEDGVSRLVCEPESALQPCGTLNPGDQVLLLERNCSVSRGGMQAEMRLVAGMPLFVNQVRAEDLALLEGIGPSLSAAIVEHRNRVGPFEQIESLLAVRGIGKKRLNRLRRHLSCAKP